MTTQISTSDKMLLNTYYQQIKNLQNGQQVTVNFKGFGRAPNQYRVSVINNEVTVQRLRFLGFFASDPVTLSYSHEHNHKSSQLLVFYLCQNMIHHDVRSSSAEKALRVVTNVATDQQTIKFGDVFSCQSENKLREEISKQPNNIQAHVLLQLARSEGRAGAGGSVLSKLYSNNPQQAKMGFATALSQLTLDDEISRLCFNVELRTLISIFNDINPELTAQAVNVIWKQKPDCILQILPIVQSATGFHYSNNEDKTRTCAIWKRLEPQVQSAIKNQIPTEQRASFIAMINLQ
ncbi:MAG: hypothetical protein ACPGUD_08200 [Parashewanella sp.]